jgi:hypothetical protein
LGALRALPHAVTEVTVRQSFLHRLAELQRAAGRHRPAIRSTGVVASS